MCVVVREEHQAQLVLGVEAVVDHDSAMRFGPAGPHHAQNDRLLTPQPREGAWWRWRLCALKLISRDCE